jgi:hypothetical protein
MNTKLFTWTRCWPFEFIRLSVMDSPKKIASVLHDFVGTCLSLYMVHTSQRFSYSGSLVSHDLICVPPPTRGR